MLLTSSNPCGIFEQVSGLFNGRHGNETLFISRSFASLFDLLTCETTEVPPPPPDVPTITLTVEDVGVTEVWLRVSMPDTVTERMFTLLRDGIPIDTSFLMTIDSVLVDEGLLPNHTYSYRALRFADTLVVDSTDNVALTTLDTTTHNFLWQFDSLGEGSSNVLTNVYIAAENDVWVVGDINLRDSSGQIDPDSYNAGHWDGVGWQIIRIIFPRDATTDLLLGVVGSFLGSRDTIVTVSVPLNFRNRSVRLSLQPLETLGVRGLEAEEWFIDAEEDTTTVMQSLLAGSSILEESVVPSSFALHQNYPNPFNPTTVINYDLPVDDNVSLKLYDMLGREVGTLVDCFQKAGCHQTTLDGSNLSTGVYVYRLRSGSFLAAKKFLLVK